MTKYQTQANQFLSIKETGELLAITNPGVHYLLNNGLVGYVKIGHLKLPIKKEVYKYARTSRRSGRKNIK